MSPLQMPATAKASQASQSFYSTVIKEKDPLKLAGQFESIYYRMILQEMRESSMEDELLGSSQMQQVMSMFHDELSLELGEAGHLGFKDMIIDEIKEVDGPIVEVSTSSLGLLKSPQLR